MTLEASFTELEDSLKCLDQALDELLWAVVQGQPQAEQGHRLAVRYDIATNDLIGWVQDAKEAAKKGHRATTKQLDLAEARLALSTCQELFIDRVFDPFYGELLSLDWMGDLETLAHERGEDWAKWTYGVKDALKRCPTPLNDVGRALFNCWKDLTEHASRVTVSAQATSTGLEFHLDREKANSRRATK
jgi:histone H3/H4